MPKREIIEYTHFMNKEIFKAYDIRGVYPHQIDESSVCRIGRAYIEFLKKEWGGLENKYVVVGCDVRTSSPSLKQELIRVIANEGVNIIDIGVVSTDMIYFAVSFLKADGGITISASHNPPEYNGMKMVRKNSIGISGDSGLKQIAKLALDNKFSYKKNKSGNITKKDILTEYIKHVRSFIDFEELKKKKLKGKNLKILINPNFGPAGAICQKLVEGLPIDLVCINCEPNGTFPEGTPNPMLEENREKMKEHILKHQVDLAVAWDADADRVFFYPENGEAIEGYFIGALLSQIILKRNRNEKNKIVLHDPRLIWAMQEAIESAGGEPKEYKTGHMFIKEGMRKYDAIFASEMSAHYYFRDNYYCDNGMIPFLLVLDEIFRTGKSISELVVTWTQKYFSPGEINFKTQHAKQILEKAQERYQKDAKISHIDGLSIEFSNWRFNIRTSNTEPLLRLNLEAKDQKNMIQKTKELTDFIDSFN